MRRCSLAGEGFHSFDLPFATALAAGAVSPRGWCPAAGDGEDLAARHPRGRTGIYGWVTNN